MGKEKNRNGRHFLLQQYSGLDLPLNHTRMKRNRLTASIQLNHPNDNSENVATAFEYDWNKLFFLRAGYKFNVDEQNYSFGAGVNIPVNVTNITVDYGFANFVKLGTSHRFSITLGL